MLHPQNSVEMQRSLEPGASKLRASALPFVPQSVLPQDVPTKGTTPSHHVEVAKSRK
jgi:hypothetical protein